MSIQQKACGIACAAVSPICKVGTKIHTSAVQKQKLYDDEWLAKVNAAKADGTDLAEQTTKTFIADSFKLVAYRIERGTYEANYVMDNWRTLDYSNYKNWIIMARFFVRLTAVYIFFYIYGRKSAFPLLTPDSPFLEGMKYQNPNGFQPQHLGL